MPYIIILFSQYVFLSNWDKKGLLLTYTYLFIPKCQPISVLKSLSVLIAIVNAVAHALEAENHTSPTCTTLLYIAVLPSCFFFSDQHFSSLLNICLICWAFLFSAESYSSLPSQGFSSMPCIFLLCRILLRREASYSAEKETTGQRRKMHDREEKTAL